MTAVAGERWRRRREGKRRRWIFNCRTTEDIGV
jgi:hypothetical protein